MQTIETARGTVTITVTDTEYVLTGPTGEHRLTIEVTGPERLLAHLEGFISNNGGAVLNLTYGHVQARSEPEVIESQEWEPGSGWYGGEECRAEQSVMIGGKVVATIIRAYRRESKHDRFALSHYTWDLALDDFGIFISEDFTTKETVKADIMANIDLVEIHAAWAVALTSD